MNKFILIFLFLMLIPNHVLAVNLITITGDSGTWDIDSSSGDFYITKTAIISEAVLNRGVNTEQIQLQVFQQNPADNPACQGGNQFLGKAIKQVSNLGYFWSSGVPITLNLGQLSVIPIKFNSNPDWVYDVGGDEYYCQIWELKFFTDQGTGRSSDVLTRYFLVDGGRTGIIGNPNPVAETELIDTATKIFKLDYLFLPGIITLFTIVSLLKLRKKNY